MPRPVVAAAFLILLLGACAQPVQAPAASTAAPQPTVQALPTASAVPPSETPVPPSETPAPPTAEALPSATPQNTTTPLPTIPPTPTLVALDAEQRQALFEQVWNLVNERYVYSDFRGLDWQATREEFAARIATVADEDVFYELMREMIIRLDDDHSRFLSPQDVAADQAEYDGTTAFGGIGVRIRQIDAGALVVDVVAGGPADLAGITRREIITRISSTNVAAAFAAGENPLLLARGEPGTQVELSVRGSDGGERTLTLTRQIITGESFPSVEAQRLPGTQTGYVRLDTFFEDAVDQKMHTALDDLLAQGELDALIIDVRDNGGGRLDFMANIASYFLDGGSIGSDSGRNQTSELEIPSGQVIDGLADTPIAILTGPDSVSAAEIFAAGMQARGRAIVVGEPSAGNTEVLLLHDLLQGAQLRLAERAYRRPDGSLLEGSGVQPDILLPAEWWKYAPADDPQVLAALAAMVPASTRG